MTLSPRTLNAECAGWCRSERMEALRDAWPGGPDGTATPWNDRPA